MNLFDFIPGYESAIYDTGREPAFVMILSFIITFIFTRGYTRIARVRGWGSASFGGVHTHHMVFGLIVAFSAGALMFSFTPDQGPALLLLAASFGCGASLVLDEFALIFHLQDVYWKEEGRKSIDAIILGLMFGSLFLLQIVPFGSTKDQSGSLIAVAIVSNLPIIVLAALKGKVYFAVFGVFIPLLALIGAVRLAEPDSIWARRFYGAEGKKIQRSRQRYERYEKKWRSRKERVWDIIGGKTRP
jgi:lysyl-tRNA synthetase class 2